MLASTSDPCVSVLVPCWNASPFLRQTLGSIAHQSHRQLEILIGVDASTDDTATIAGEFAAGEPRARVWCRSERLGWIGNSNALLQQARAPFAFFCGHDDQLDARYVEVLVTALLRAPAAALAFSDMRHTHLDGSVEHQVYAELEGCDDAVERGLRVLSRRGPWSTSYRGIFRTEWARRGGPGLRRHPRGELGADWAWLLRLALRGAAVRVPGELYLKHDGPRSLHRSWQDRGTRVWLAALWSCCQEIGSAPISRGQRARLLLEAGRIAGDWVLLDRLRAGLDRVGAAAGANGQRLGR